MKSSAFYAVIGVGVIAVAVIIWWGVTHSHKVAPAAQQPSPITQVATSTLQGLSIYTNGTYGFTMLYPSSLPKVIGSTNVQPVVQFGTPSEYVSVSVLSDSASVANCTNLQTNEIEHAPIIMEGVTWHDFSKNSAGMDVSYRTVHDSSCFVLHEVAPSAPDDTLYGLVHSFTFAR